MENRNYIVLLNDGTYIAPNLPTPPAATPPGLEPKYMGSRTNDISKTARFTKEDAHSILERYRDTLAVFKVEVRIVLKTPL